MTKNLIHIKKLCNVTVPCFIGYNSASHKRVNIYSFAPHKFYYTSLRLLATHNKFYSTDSNSFENNNLINVKSHSVTKGKYH